MSKRFAWSSCRFGNWFPQDCETDVVITTDPPCVCNGTHLCNATHYCSEAGECLPAPPSCPAAPALAPTPGCSCPGPGWQFYTDTYGYTWFPWDNDTVTFTALGTGDVHVAFAPTQDYYDTNDDKESERDQ